MPQHDLTPNRRAADPGNGDPRRALAWRRYKALMGWMALASIAAIAFAIVYLAFSGVTLTIHMIIATAAGVGLSVLLGTALMGLVYFSNNSGHDDGVDARKSHDGKTE